LVFLFSAPLPDLGELVLMLLGDVEIILDKGTDGRDEAGFHFLEFVD
jgi:hypothetical protein